MKIHDARLSAQTLTLRRALRTSRGECRVREGWVLTLRAGDACGQGEATPHPFCDGVVTTSTFAELTSAVSALTGIPLPDDVAGIESLVRSLATAPPARHAVESALLDLLAQSRGVCVAALLSSSARASVAVNALLVEDEPRALFEEARRAVDAGFKTLKVKVGLPDDEARLTAVREGAGGAVKLRVDANGAWTLAKAQEALSRLSRFGLELCEQPVGPFDVAGLRKLREEARCRIAADESLAVEGDLEKLLPDGGAAAVDLLVLRPMMLGGVLPCLRAAERAASRGVFSYVASGLDGAVARAAAAHLAGALPLPLGEGQGEGGLAHGLGVASLFEEHGRISDPHPVENGRIQLSTAPGLGLEVRP